MNRFRNYVLMAVGLAVLVMMVGVSSAGPAIAQAVRAVLVSNVDEPGRIPYELNLNIINSLNCTAGCRANVAPPPVPAGKRLVITNVSGIIETNLPGGTRVVPVVAGYSLVYPAVIYAGSAQGRNTFVFNQATRLSFNPGESPDVALFLGAASSESVLSAFNLSGYLLDCTTGTCAAILHN